MKPEKELSVFKEKEAALTSGIDIGLILMFLKMTPEERLQANDNAINAIAELRNAFAQKQSRNSKP